MTRIYMDHNATTPVAPEVLAAVMPYYSEEWGNASSVHWAGRGPKNAIDDAREALCSLIGAPPRDLFFTSGGTESDNTALIGVAHALASKGRHIVTSVLEHPAILDTLESLERLHGYEVTRLEVDSDGQHDLDALAAALRDDTVLVSIMLANNELGNINPIAAMAEIAHEAGVLFHCDAVNALGKIPVDVAQLGVDLLSVSAHKIYAPKGVGALYVKRKTPFEAFLRGGGQERGRRCGTYNTAGIVGFGKAAELAVDHIHEAAIASVTSLRDRLEDRILADLDDVELNGSRQNRLPNTTNLSFDGVDGEGLVLSLDLSGIAISTGSACSSGSLEPSHVLLGLDKDPRWLEAAIRLSIGRSNDVAQVDQVAQVMVREVVRLRALVAEAAG